MRGKEKKKSRIGNESADDVHATREPPDHPQQQHPQPLEPFQDTAVLQKPLGLRINKTTLQVTYVEESGASVGRVSVGDIITAVDGQKITTIAELNEILKKPSTLVTVGFKRACYSKCKHKGTFVDKISVERDREMKCTGRAIDLYLVQMALRISDIVDVNEMLGLSVKYDAKERIQVSATAAKSLSSVHLRPGDIIREVNEHPIASKTMLDHFIQAGIIENGQINFTIESSAGGLDAYRDQVDLASDVLEIAQKQIVQFRAALAAKTLNRPSVLHKQHVTKTGKKIVISDQFVEVPIAADYDPSKLKPCRGGNAEARAMQNI